MIRLPSAIKNDKEYCDIYNNLGKIKKPPINFVKEVVCSVNSEEIENVVNNGNVKPFMSKILTHRILLKVQGASQSKFNFLSKNVKYNLLNNYKFKGVPNLISLLRLNIVYNVIYYDEIKRNMIDEEIKNIEILNMDYIHNLYIEIKQHNKTEFEMIMINSGYMFLCNIKRATKHDVDKYFDNYEQMYKRYLYLRWVYCYYYS